MRHFKSIKCTVLFLVLSFLFNGTAAYSQAKIGDLIESIKALKEVYKAQKAQDHKSETNKKNNENDGEKSPSSGIVTLIVSADGPTKDEATKTALRSAIEQAYGTFVSANTTILNDELVKDEIVTISNGNIEAYEEISSEQMPDGKIYVTLQATVSISKLISYAQSKGAETEFAGARLAMNLEMKELNRQNEIKVLENLENQLSNIHNLYDYELKLAEPYIKGGVAILEGTVYLKYNANTELYNNLLFKTLGSLTLSPSEIAEYYEVGLPVYNMDIKGLDKVVYLGNPNPENDFTLRSNYFERNGEKRWEKFQHSVCYQRLCMEGPREFIISDNLTSPTKLEYFITSFGFDLKPYSYQLESTSEKRKKTWYSDLLFAKKQVIRLVRNKEYHIGKVVGTVNIVIKVPQEEIHKYSGFIVEPSNNQAPVYMENVMNLLNE